MVPLPCSGRSKIFREDIVYGVDGTTEARRFRALNGLALKKRLDGRLEVGPVLGIFRILVIVNRAAVQQPPLRIDQKYARSLLREPLLGDGGGGVVKDRKLEITAGNRRPH